MSNCRRTIVANCSAVMVLFLPHLGGPARDTRSFPRDSARSPRQRPAWCRFACWGLVKRRGSLKNSVVKRVRSYGLSEGIRTNPVANRAGPARSRQSDCNVSTLSSAQRHALATSSHAREGSRLVSMDPLAACRQQRHLEVYSARCSADMAREEISNATPRNSACRALGSLPVAPQISSSQIQIFLAAWSKDSARR